MRSGETGAPYAGIVKLQRFNFAFEIPDNCEKMAPVFSLGIVTDATPQVVLRLTPGLAGLGSGRRNERLGDQARDWRQLAGFQN